MTHQRALFRQEAIDFQQHHRHWGQVALLQPLSTKITVWFIVVAVMLILVFVILAPYTRKETVSGYLMPTAGTARVHAPQPGIISAIHVADGDVVEENQPLLSVSTTQVTTEDGDVNTAILASLIVQRELLTGQVAVEGQRTVLERGRLEASVQGLQTEILHQEAQLLMQRERIRLSEEAVSTGAQLNSKGYVSDMDYRRRAEALLEQRQALEVLGQQVAARRNQITETRYALEQLPIATADRIRTLRGELASSEQRIAEINGRRAYVIRAPIAGRVSALQATVGQSVEQRRLQLTIVPQGSTLQAELFVPTRAVGFIRTGQPVRILYDAFPYQHFGTYGGKIVRVSQTILTEADATGPVALREPAYRVSAALDRPDVDAYGERIPLQPDMLLRADVILDRRSLAEWLLQPLLGARARSGQP